MNLNKESLDVWYELLRNSKYLKISERLIELTEKDVLTEDEKLEFSTFIKLEKKFLKESNEKVEESRKLIKKVNAFKNKLGDIRLINIFIDRVTEELEKEQSCSEEMINDIYIKLMEEDMDIKGHENLNRIYEEMVINEKANELNITCPDPNCIYCKPMSDKEFDLAYKNLIEGGYLDKSPEDGLIDLMVLVQRLENELNQYTSFDCDDILDDEDE